MVSFKHTFTEKSPDLVRPLSAIRPFTYRFICYWATLFWSLWETILLPVLCAANKRRQGITNLHRHHPLRVPIHSFVVWGLGNSFPVPREIHISSVQDSNLGTLNLYQCALLSHVDINTHCCLTGR